MAVADHVEVLYHLTPKGWVRGTVYFSGKANDETPAPVDRLLTSALVIEQVSHRSRETRKWVDKWRSPDISIDALSKLEAKYPRPK